MYVRIIDQGECLSTTREYVDGVYANKNEWAKHNFYPKNGMVGELVKRTPMAYIVKIMDGIYVPMTRKGIEEISSKDYETGVKNNLCCGMDERQKKKTKVWLHSMNKQETIGFICLTCAKLLNKILFVI